MMQIYCYLTILQIEITFLYRHMTIFNFLSKLMDTLIDRIKMIIEAKGYSPRAFEMKKVDGEFIKGRIAPSFQFLRINVDSA